jgi:hypothetical protein
MLYDFFSQRDRQGKRDRQKRRVTDVMEYKRDKRRINRETRDS